MEAKKVNRKLIDKSLLFVDGKAVYVEYHYKTLSALKRFNPSLLVITYDGELTDSFIKSVIDSYSGDYPVFHIFKSEKLFASDITEYMKELFNVQSKEVDHE